MPLFGYVFTRAAKTDRSFSIFVLLLQAESSEWPCVCLDNVSSEQITYST